jgi:DNA-binding transcriptional MerR regulator
LSIGELSERTGVPASALRYYDELGLVRPASRAAGRRRYASSAVADVGVVLFLREVGFSLAEIGRLTAAHGRSWRTIIEHKLAELAEQQHRIEVARAALEHGLRCPAGEPTKCSRFWSIIEGHMSGLSLEDSHARGHAQPRPAARRRSRRTAPEPSP